VRWGSGETSEVGEATAIHSVVLSQGAYDMANWINIRDSADRFVLWTKGSVVLDAAAKVMLQNIPVVGKTLADLYDAAEGKNDESNTELIQEILARVDAWTNQVSRNLRKRLKRSGILRLKQVSR
jgi:hypothetical protein